MRSILDQKGILIARLPVLYDVIFLREMSRNNSIKFWFIRSFGLLRQYHDKDVSIYDAI